MKKIVALFFAFCAVALPLCADAFTDIIQDLAAQTACLGVYSATQAGGGWYEDPQDYYTPRMMAQRFARMSGKKTRTETFYGVCFDYAEYAYNDIERYLDMYNECGMEGKQYYIAGVHSNYNQITLQWPVKASEADRHQNGIPVRDSKWKSNIKTHRLGNTGARATDHAWLWIQRNDGVWFWIDPTWTDNVGYVVWGCVYNGEEVQLKPEPALCIVYPSYLNSLPSAPPHGSKTPVPAPQVAQVQPAPRPSTSPTPATRPSTSTSPSSRPSSSTSRPSSSSSRPPSSSRSSSSSAKRYNWGLSVGVSSSVSVMLGNDNSTNIGLSVGVETGNGPLYLLLQGDYYTFNTQSLLASAAVGWQFVARRLGLGLYAGGGLAFIFNFDDISLAWKVFGGVRFMFGPVSLRADVSYLKDEGVVLAAFAGLMF